jgi:hypothetical protein
VPLLWFGAAAIVVGYAFALALGFYGQDDLFFLLNDARWTVQHWAVPWADHFAYLAGGEWIYPVGGGLIFYGMWSLGGYAALTYFTAGCAATATTLVLRKGSAGSLLLAVIAVPAIVSRSTVRADTFTTVLIAAFLAILWRYHETGRARLWLLPVLMVAWANLHLGFPVGFLLIAGYVGVEVLDLPWAERRTTAIQRLRRSWPWLALCIPATLLNPFGIWVYEGILAQHEGQWGAGVGEWQALRLSSLSLFFNPNVDNVGNGNLLLFIAAVVVVIIALWRRQLGAAAFVAGAIALAAEYERLEAFAAIVTTLIGGSPLIVGFAARWGVSFKAAATALAAAIMCGLVVHNDRLGQPWFSAGLDPEMPTRAVDFIEREHLLGNGIGAGEDGGYVVWRLPQYLADVDARDIPFLHPKPPDPSLQIYVRLLTDTNQPPVSSGWDAHPLTPYCQNDGLVYLDEVSAVVLRRAPETEELIKRHRIDCATAPLPATIPEGPGAWALWEQAAIALDQLGRHDEARMAIRQAAMAGERASLKHRLAGVLGHNTADDHLLAGEEAERAGDLANAEREYSTAAVIKPDAGNQAALAGIYHRQGRVADEIAALRRAIDLAWGFDPRLLKKWLGEAENARRAL